MEQFHYIIVVGVCHSVISTPAKFWSEMGISEPPDGTNSLHMLLYLYIKTYIESYQQRSIFIISTLHAFLSAPIKVIRETGKKLQRVGKQQLNNEES